MYKYFISFTLLNIIVLSAKAQNPTLNNRKTKRDSINLQQDSLTSKPFAPKVKHGDQKYYPDSTHNPQKAMIRSLIVPGLGQIYNYHWWKVPLIYTALGLLGDAYVFNEKRYQEFLALSKSREHITPISPASAYYKDYILFANVRDQTIYDYNDSYRRDRDLSIMGFIAFWGIQVVDAFIDAKFQHSYTMDTDFSLKIDPAILNQNMLAQGFNRPVIPELKLSLTF